MPSDVTHRRFRLSDESDQPPYSKAAAHRAVRTDGSLGIKDLPEAWRAQMSETLGLVPPDDRDGCLQDVHWFSGSIGGAFQKLHNRQYSQCSTLCHRLRILSANPKRD